MENASFLQGKRVCAAVSGGVDSVALLYFLQMRAPIDGFSLRVVHCQHGIRGEDSLADMRFVVSLCEKLALPLDVFEEDCLLKARREKLSVETAARNFRRACYESILLSGKADYIATAHHAGDQAETVLFRIARGASITGASGMKEVDGKYLKPFLHKTKAELYKLVEESGYGYVVDQTNFEKCATRNKIRLDVLPALEEAVPGATGAIARFAFLAAEDDEYLYRLAEKQVQEDSVVLCEDKPVFRRACMLLLKKMGKEKDVSRQILDEAYKLQFMQTGSRMTAKNGVEIKKVYDRLFFYLPAGEEANLPEIPFQSGVFKWGRYEISVTDAPTDGALSFDVDKLKGTVIREARTGDYIEKFGGGTKSVKKYLTDKKVSADERHRLPVVAGSDGEVYLIGGVDISQKIKVTDSTRTIGYFTIEKLG
ncbi:MAG: tRNA lysidine(34) synthetase TilS [Clostridia bacterium]|nr:tRNA lysidine(34) synthetase TilS [Clostridia bacterium]